MELPYIEKTKVVRWLAYNPKYGDNRICQCAHPYYRHFDSYEDMKNIGCKYCMCDTFVESTLDYPTIREFMTQILRHPVEDGSVVVDVAGWANLNSVLDECACRFGNYVSYDHLKNLVSSDPDKSFEINTKYNLIRARSGHSIPVNLEIEFAEYVPQILYFATTNGSAKKILKRGILTPVVLSETVDHARKFGPRFRNHAILEVSASLMHQYGRTFYNLDNGAYLTADVPCGYISLKSDV